MPPSVLDIVRVIVLAVALISLALWGVFSWPLPWNVVAAVGAPALVLLMWALFVSPRAVLKVHPFVRALVELAIYSSVTVAWWSMGQTWVGLAFAVVAVTCGLMAGRRALP